MPTFGQIFGKGSDFFKNRKTEMGDECNVSDVFEGCRIDVGDFLNSEEYSQWSNEYLSLSGEHPLIRFSKQIEDVKWPRLKGAPSILCCRSLKSMIMTLHDFGLWKL